MSHVAQLRLAASGLRPQPGIGICGRFMGLVLALFPFEVDLSSRSSGLPTPILWSETLLTGPGLNQRSVHSEMFIRQERPSFLQHPREKCRRDLLVQQSL